MVIFSFILMSFTNKIMKQIRECYCKVNTKLSDVFAKIVAISVSSLKKVNSEKLRLNFWHR